MQFLIKIGIDEIVGIDKTDIFAGSDPDTEIAGEADAVVLSAYDQFDPGIVVLLDFFNRTVG